MLLEHKKNRRLSKRSGLHHNTCTFQAPFVWQLTDHCAAGAQPSDHVCRMLFVHRQTAPPNALPRSRVFRVSDCTVACPLEQCQWYRGLAHVYAASRPYFTLPPCVRRAALPQSGAGPGHTQDNPGRAHNATRPPARAEHHVNATPGHCRCFAGNGQRRWSKFRGQAGGDLDNRSNAITIRVFGNRVHPPPPHTY